MVIIEVDLVQVECKMNYLIDICSNCGRRLAIVNKKYYLCPFCNKERIGSKNGVKRNIKPISERKKREHDKLKKVYSQMTEDSCFFCGSKNNLTNAHIIRRSYSEKLITNPENIVKACLSCHNTFDNGTIAEILTLNNLSEILKRMKKLDYFYYQRFKTRLNYEY